MMKKLTKEERNQLRQKIQEDRQRQNQIVRQTIRENEEEYRRMAFGEKHYVTRPLLEFILNRIPNLSFRGKLLIGLCLSFGILLILIIFTLVRWI